MNEIVYHFQFPDGHSVSIGNGGGGTRAAPNPDWTKLDYQQCPNCPLSSETVPHCPMAVQLVRLVGALGGRRSYDPVRVEVETPERRVHKETTVQRAAGSLMGLLAAGSGCPNTAFLAPMAHFHLPFSTEEETIYRVASTYLLAQYLGQQEGRTPDWELAGLKAHYQDLQVVNAAMASRLRALSAEDGAINALVLLDLLAKALPYSIDAALEEIACHFQAS